METPLVPRSRERRARMVPAEGLEPPPLFREQILSPSRVFSAISLNGILYSYFSALGTVYELPGIVTLTAWLRHGRCFSVSECAR